jgi:hypothetical protein
MRVFDSVDACVACLLSCMSHPTLMLMQECVYLPAFLAASPMAVVHADAQPTALLSVISSAVVLADARPAALLARAFYAVVLADA